MPSLAVLLGSMMEKPSPCPVRLCECAGLYARWRGGALGAGVTGGVGRLTGYMDAELNSSTQITQQTTESFL